MVTFDPLRTFKCHWTFQERSARLQFFGCWPKRWKFIFPLCLPPSVVKCVYSLCQLWARPNLILIFFSAKNASLCVASFLVESLLDFRCRFYFAYHTIYVCMVLRYLYIISCEEVACRSMFILCGSFYVERLLVACFGGLNVRASRAASWLVDGHSCPQEQYGLLRWAGCPARENRKIDGKFTQTSPLFSSPLRGPS